MVIGGIVAALGPLLTVGGQAASTISQMSVAATTAGTSLTAIGTAVLATVAPWAIAVSVIAVGISALKNWKNEINDSIAETKRQHSSLVSSTGTYEDYTKAVMENNKAAEQLDQTMIDSQDGWSTAMRNVEALSDQMPMLTKNEWELARAIDEADAYQYGLDTGYYGDQAEIAAAHAAELATSLDGVADGASSISFDTTDFNNILGLARDFDDALTGIAEAQEQVNRLTEISQTGGYLDGVYYSASAAQEKIGEITGTIDGLNQAMADAANQMVLDLLKVQITADGVVSDAEMEAYFRLAEEMGLISEEAANRAMEVYGNAVDYINGLEIEDKSAVFSVDIVTSGSFLGASIAGNARMFEYAAGGYDRASTATGAIFGEGGGETAFFVPDGKTLWDVAPEGMVQSALGARSGGHSDYIKPSSGQDGLTAQDIAIAVRDAFLQARES